MKKKFVNEIKIEREIGTERFLIVIKYGNEIENAIEKKLKNENGIENELEK